MFQKEWQFSGHRFVTMQDWKSELYNPDYPVLKEEKRTLAFYLSLSDSMKDFFKIRNYFQSIELGQNFFKFWEEMNEELVSDKDIRDVILERESAGEWQQKSFGAFLQMRDEYRQYLQKHNFSDLIFFGKEAKLSHTDCRMPLVVVNQFYFTRLEKKLLNQVADSTIYLQLPRECYQEETLSVNYDFGSRHLQTATSVNINVIRATDQQSMVLSLLNHLEELTPDAVIDFRFNDQPYSHFFSPRHFSRPRGESLKNSVIFRILKHIHNIISNAVEIRKKTLLPLEMVIHACYDRELRSAVFKDSPAQAVSVFLDKLAENDYQYIDLEGDFLRINRASDEVSATLNLLLKLVKEFSNVTSMEEISSLISNKVQQLSSDWETSYTDLPQQIFTALPDFQAPAECGIITEYKQLFRPSRNQNSSMAVAAGILKLFLDYLKFKQFSVTLKDQEKDRLKISSLVDSRNLKYQRPVILNVTEGILPQSRKTPFLLSEKQRQQLGLKTYDDIRLRDKYYFYRLLAVADEPTIYTIKNIDTNTDVSSFLEELMLDKTFNITITDEASYDLQKFYDDFVQNQEYKLPQKSDALNEEFFNIPCDPKTDFPENSIKLGFYQWENMIGDPMLYYLRQVLKLKEPVLEIRADFSEKFIGNLTHDIITLIWNRILDVYQGDVIHHNFMYNSKDYVDKAVSHILEHDHQLIYKSPHNYSWLYFSRVFLPILKEGIANFFYRLHNDLELSDVSLKVIPETREVFEKKLAEIENGLDIFLRMKADLRLETENMKYIFDYKTGIPNATKETRFKAQLQLYELLFYLLDNWQMMDQVSSWLFFVEAKQMHTPDYRRISREDAMEIVKNATIEGVKHILENGFTIPEKVTALEDNAITRRDLWRRL
jgi:hypothetical protein